MPISSIDGCSAEHWDEVKAIFCEAVEAIPNVEFTVRLVSEADDVGVIQKRIVQNVYNSDMIICDVSCKNPNVMFELGMRLAFDRPTVIVKDDKTDYSFDTGVIEHITYPRDLRFSKMVAFKAQLAEKVLATHRAATENKDHSTFLKNFGTFKVASLTQSEVSADLAVFEVLSDLQREVSALRRLSESKRFSPSNMSTSSARRRIQTLINEYIQMKPNEMPHSQNVDFMHFLDKHFNPQEYFSNQKEYEKVVDDLVIPF